MRFVLQRMLAIFLLSCFSVNGMSELVHEMEHRAHDCRCESQPAHEHGANEAHNDPKNSHEPHHHHDCCTSAPVLAIQDASEFELVSLSSPDLSPHIRGEDQRCPRTWVEEFDVPPIRSRA